MSERKASFKLRDLADEVAGRFYPSFKTRSACYYETRLVRWRRLPAAYYYTKICAMRGREATSLRPREE